MLSVSDPLDATSLNFWEPLSSEWGVPDRVRVLLSTSSHDGASDSEYFVSASLLENVLWANANRKGCDTRATGGSCALIG